MILITDGCTYLAPSWLFRYSTGEYRSPGVPGRCFHIGGTLGTRRDPAVSSHSQAPSQLLCEIFLLFS